MINITQLRSRYKQILNRKDEQQQQQDYNKQNRSIMPIKKSNNIKQRILTQHHDNMSTSKIINDKFYNHQIIIKLKERIAQNIKIIAEKDQEIAGSKEEIIRYEQKLKNLGQRLAQQQQKVASLQQKIIEQKINANCLQKQIKNKNKKTQQQKLDKQILLSQIQFYKKQINGLKINNKGLLKKIEKCDKQNDKCQMMKNQIYRLKQDVKRMHVFINQYSLNNKDVNFNNKHFIAVCMKELNNHWVPTNLIGQVQLFLRKQQVAAGNTTFLNNLVKFINKITQLNQEKRQNTKCNQAKRQNTTKNKANRSQMASKKQSHYRSSSLGEDTESIMKRTDCMTQSFIKKSTIMNKCKKIQSRMYTQNIKFPDKIKRDIKSCSQIFDEYQDVLKQALNENQIKSKNILLLSDQLRRNIFSLME